MHYNQVLQQIFKRLNNSNREELLLYEEEISAWPEDCYTMLLRQGIIKPASPARSINCPGCEENCFMDVNVLLGTETRPTRYFVFCNRRDDTGRIAIDKKSLQRWQINIDNFIQFIATSLGTNHQPEKIIQDCIYYLGTVTLNRKRRAAFIILKLEEAALKQGCLYNFNWAEQYPYPFFLMSEITLGRNIQRYGVVIAFQHILKFERKGLTLHHEELKRLLSKKGGPRQDIIPLQLPHGTTWEQIAISFVNSQTVSIRFRKSQDHRSFDEMGFSDNRKGVTQPTQLWNIFYELAKTNGELYWDNSQKTFDNPIIVKKWISLIRKKLKKVFPTIQEDPFFPYQKTKGYKTKFILNIPPQAPEFDEFSRDF